MSKGTFGFGMLIGAVTGYAAAMFLAPKPGSETQEEWKEKAQEYMEKAKEQGTQLKEKVSSSDDEETSDGIDVYSTQEGISGTTDALAVGPEEDQRTAGGVTPEGAVEAADLSHGVQNVAVDDTRYREADPMNDELRP